MKRFTGIRSVLAGAALIVAGSSFVCAAPPVFDTGGVKMVAPMSGLGCGANKAGGCSSAPAPDVTGIVRQANNGQAAALKKGGIPTAPPPNARRFEGVARKQQEAVDSTRYQKNVDKYKSELKTGVFSKGGFATGVYGSDQVVDTPYPDAGKQGGYQKSEAAPKFVSAKPEDDSQGRPAVLKADERIYILISSSIPLSTLRAYARDIGALGNPNIRMVMRGFVGEGGMKNGAATMQFIGKILNEDPEGCAAGGNCDSFPAIVDIDPNIFRRYKPEVSPAFVYARGVKTLMPDASEGLDEVAGVLSDADVLMTYGDMPLSYALEIFAEHAGDPRIKAVGDKLRMYN